MFEKKAKVPTYEQELEETVDDLQAELDETYSREAALEAALIVHGYLNDTAPPGNVKNSLEVLTSAQLFYDFLSGDAEFRYSRDEPTESGAPVVIDDQGRSHPVH